MANCAGQITAYTPNGGQNQTTRSNGSLQSLAVGNVINLVFGE